MFNPDQVRLQHMLAAAGEAVSFVQGRSRADLNTDRMLNLALVRLLEIIGEAAAGISPTCRNAYPQLPWSQMVGMRNRLIHGYFDINLDVVWETVTQDLPSLLAILETLISPDVI